MEDFNIGAMKARNIAAQFGVIEKAETSYEEVIKAHQVGDIHPNGKWVWTEYRPGHFDWRPLKGGSNGGNSGGRNIQSEKNKTFDSEYDAQKLEHLSEDELSESAKKFGVKTGFNRYGEIYLRIESKKEVNNLKKFLSSNGIEYDESKLSKQPGFYGTHSYGYDLYSGKQENSIGYYERKARYIQNDIDYLTNSSKNHPDVGQRAAAKKELENGSLKRELDEVKEKIASLKKILK